MNPPDTTTQWLVSWLCWLDLRGHDPHFPHRYVAHTLLADFHQTN